MGLGLLLAWALLCRLVYGSVGLGEGRFWDERYSLENVRHILETGRLEAVTGWYPMPSYLPHTALLAAVRELHDLTGWERLAVLGPRGFTPNAYLLCRSLQALFGTVSLLCLFLLVRRLGDWREALLATLLLAATPNHLRLSVIFKPDALLLMTTLLAVLVAVRVVERRPTGRMLLVHSAAAGAMVALAASASLLGVLVAVPVGLAVLLAGDGWRERIGGLVAATLSSAVLSFALNPAWRLQLHFLERIRRQYREQSVGQGHLDVLIGEMEALLDSAFFGPVLGALGLIGLVALLAGMLRDLDRRRPLAVALAFPVGFSLLFAASTTYAKQNHFLQVAPYVAWGAAHLLLRGGTALWGAVAESARARRRVLRSALLLALAAGSLWRVGSSSRLVYEAKVPTTASLLARRMLPYLDPLAWRVVPVEATVESSSPPLVRWRDRAATPQVASLVEVSEDALRLGDGVVVLAGRLAGPRGAQYAALLDRLAPTRRLEARPRIGRSRGPALAAVLYPWRAVGEVAAPMTSSSPGSWGVTLPEAGGEVRSLRLWLPRLDEPPRLEVGGRSVALHSTRTDGRKDRYLSPRLRDVGGGEVRLRLPVEVELAEEPVLEVRSWAPAR